MAWVEIRGQAWRRAKRVLVGRNTLAQLSLGPMGCLSSPDAFYDVFWPVIQKMDGVPEDAAPAAFRWSNEYNALDVEIRSESFPIVPWNEQCPIILGIA